MEAYGLHALWASSIVTFHRADSRLAPSQWEMALLCNTISHWLGSSLESALRPHWCSGEIIGHLVNTERIYKEFKPIFYYWRNVWIGQNKIAVPTNWTYLCVNHICGIYTDKLNSQVHNLCALIMICILLLSDLLFLIWLHLVNLFMATTRDVWIIPSFRI